MVLLYTPMRFKEIHKTQKVLQILFEENLSKTFALVSLAHCEHILFDCEYQNTLKWLPQKYLPTAFILNLFPLRIRCDD